jgi:hypothetical protein
VSINLRPKTEKITFPPTNNLEVGPPGFLGLTEIWWKAGKNCDLGRIRIQKVGNWSVDVSRPTTAELQIGELNFPR